MKLKLSKGAKTTWVRAAVIGICFALVVSVALTALLGKFALNGTIGESGVGLAVFVIRLLSVAVGGFVGTGLTDGKLLPVVGVITAGYLLFLLAAGIILFDGSFNRFASGLVSAVLGGAVVALIRSMPKKSKNHFQQRLR